VGSTSALPLALAGAVLLALSTLWMTPEQPEQRELRVILVDVSASTTRPSPNFASRVRSELEQEALAAEESGEELLIVVAGAEVRRVFGPDSPEQFRAELRGEAGPPFDPIPADEVGTRSDLAQAARLIRELLDKSGATKASLLTIGDGSYTGTDPSSAIGQLVASGVAWRGNLRVPAERTDAVLSDLRAASELEEGALLTATVRVDLREGALGVGGAERVVLRATNGESVRTQTADLAALYAELAESEGLDTASAVFSFNLGPVGPGRTVLEARLETESGAPSLDPIPENDRLQRSVYAGEPLVVGWLSAPELEPNLREFAASLPAGFSSLFLQPDQLVGALSELDALFVFDRSLEDLPAGLCESFVKSGGGLFLAGGWSLLRGWDASEVRRVRELLPLQLRSDALPERDVIVLVDGSGSMAGEPFELVRGAVRELVRAAPARDEIRLVFFTLALHASRTLREARGEVGSVEERERVASELLAARVPGGTTRILDSLAELVSSRQLVNREALVLLLSDGREDNDVVDPVERARELRAEVSAEDMRVIAFAIGEEANVDFLRTLVSDEQDLYAGDELTNLGELFGREVNRERVREGSPIALSAKSGPLAREILAAELDPPPLGRLIRMELAPPAEAVLVSDEGEPVMAVLRVGRGRVVQLASLPFADWGAAWSRELGELVPALTWCARRSDDAGGLTLEQEGDQVVLRGVEADTPPILTAQLTGTEPDRSSRSLLFTRPTSGSGVSRPEVRTADLPDWLARLDPGWFSLEFRSNSGELLFTAALPRTRHPEFSEPRRYWRQPPPSSSDGLDREPGSTRLGGEERPEGPGSGHPAARALLLGGAILVLIAAWQVSFRSSRQGVARTDR